MLREEKKRGRRDNHTHTHWVKKYIIHVFRNERQASWSSTLGNVFDTYIGYHQGKSIIKKKSMLE